ncbi:MAG: hydroxyacid dehydrogenase [Bacteroidales bacterium]|nr:hydroxyacid dehydrogenase [Bacteroidales bacterium]
MKMVFLDAGTMGPVSLDPIAALGELTLYPVSTHREACERVADADVILTNKAPVDDAIMAAAPALRLICVSATGLNHIDLEAARRRGIAVRNVVGYSTESVMQLTFTHILSLLCRPAFYDAEVKDFTYSRSGVPNDVREPFHELFGKTIGIVGMGNIGQRVAQVASAFGMKPVYYSTSGTSHCTEWPSLPLDELMKVSDIVSIHCPLNERTRALIGARELALMKPGAYLVNLGRGAVVDEAALAEAIDKCRIAGAALDVFSTEPIPEEHPLLHTSHPERLRFTPHIAWASYESLDRLVQKMVENIREVFPQ